MENFSNKGCYGIPWEKTIGDLTSLHENSDSEGQKKCKGCKNQLNAFTNEVNAQTGKKITASQAAQLLLDAQDISNLIS